MGSGTDEVEEGLGTRDWGLETFPDPWPPNPKALEWR
jgi:hypothetical protein